MKSWLVVATLLLGASANGQLITGRVLDAETLEPIGYANVYFNNSKMGTATDIDGNFRLNAYKHPGESIVVSCMGYASELISSYKPSNRYVVHLTPQVTLLKEVLIVADDTPRNEKLATFLKEFIGETPNSNRCSIKNESDLQLVYVNSTTLKAYSYQPLVIVNRSLGYKVTYFLDEFTKEPAHIFFKGNSIFSDDTVDVSQVEWRRILKRRKEAYLGSFMHFFRALSRGQLREEGFEVWSSDTRTKVESGDIVKTEGDTAQYMVYPSSLVINFKPKRELTYLDFKKGNKVFFNSRGFFDPHSLTWTGGMARRRVADLLPYEYEP